MTTWLSTSNASESEKSARGGIRLVLWAAIALVLAIAVFLAAAHSHPVLLEEAAAGMAGP